jgi:hypothetical protein
VVFLVLFLGYGLANLITRTWRKERQVLHLAILTFFPAIGFLGSGMDPRLALVSPALWSATFSVFFTFASIVTLQRRQSSAVGVSAGLMLIAGGASALLLDQSGITTRPIDIFSLVSGALCLTGAVFLVHSHLVALKARNENRAHVAINFSLRAFIALHLGESVALRPELALPALVFYCLFELTLARFNPFSDRTRHEPRRPLEPKELE